MNIVHLMASSFFGGPERQVLGLAQHLPPDVQSALLLFSRRGSALPFAQHAHEAGLTAKMLIEDTPRYFACVREVGRELLKLKADLLCCHGYKADLVGLRAARRVGIPVISVSRGWTRETWKVGCYERLDRMALPWMDAVVCVSEAQAEKVRLANVRESAITVIHNGKGEDAFLTPKPSERQLMLKWFTNSPHWIIGAAGRLSPEKGYSVFIESAALVAKSRPDAGFVLFGTGVLREVLERQIMAAGLQGRFVLAGFSHDLGRYLPNLDLHVMSSYTEGLPNILLEAGAAGIATVATSVGGIPEVVEDGQSGYLVPVGDSLTMAERIVGLLDQDEQREAMGEKARQRVRDSFSFSNMSERYLDLFRRVTMSHTSKCKVPPKRVASAALM